MQVDPIKPTLKAPGTKHLKLKPETLLSTSAFKINLRRYTLALDILRYDATEVGRCRLTVSKSELNARLVSELETNM